MVPSVTPQASSSPEGWRVTEKPKEQVLCLKANPTPKPQDGKLNMEPDKFNSQGVES